MRMKVEQSVKINAKPMITPIRQPMNRVTTTMMMTSASPKAWRKPLTASLTTSDCQWTLWTSMPIGSSLSSSARRASIASPTSTTLTPDSFAIEMPIAGSPPKRISCDGGSA